MSYTNQGEGELDEKSQNQGTGSSQGVEDAQTTQPPEGEGGESEEKAEAFDETLLDIKEPEPQKVQKVKKEDEGKKQVNTWYNRIVNEEMDDNDEVYTLDHPKIPQWVKQSIEKRLGNQVEQPQDYSDIKKEVKDDIKYETLIGKIPKLPKSQQLQIHHVQDRVPVL